MKWAGGAVLALLLLFIFGTLLAVALRADDLSGLPSDFWPTVWFTLMQATLSGALSVLLAIPVARALMRRSFRGKALLIALLGAPFILPVIVAVLGLLSVFGRGGLLNTAVGWFGGDPVSVYGLTGILLAHAYFNLPLATRLLLQGWQDIPQGRVRLAQSLGMRGMAAFRHIEWPMLRDRAPGIFLAIFTICLTSFSVILLIGGGPRATTIELAIYEAFRFDFDLGKAALLALVQFAICGFVAVIALQTRLPQSAGSGVGHTTLPVLSNTKGIGAFDGLAIFLATAFLLIPLGMMLAKGVSALGDMHGAVWPAAIRSLVIAVASALGSVVMALALCLFALSLRRGAALIDGLGFLILATSPLVMGTGLFLIVFPFVNPTSVALWVTGLVNATVAMPFILRSILPALQQAERDHGRLADSLGLLGWARLRWMLVPRIRPALGFGAGLAAALSMGDLGVITLFSDPQRATLPMEMFRLMSSYRQDSAMAAALLLVGLSFGLFWLFDKWGRRYA
ncbi:thiamine/thiamine pyrophosphate ABC transporter permease ThiP [Nereida sp. MMG025]|uniref:thiamine/thiamine pyrophosphate ABC transporter permease ThiP n=1 Tax=Nereida sp. MMG025 TaxID=2909981 RepID=UPI00351CCF52